MSENNKNSKKDSILYVIWDWVKTIAIALIITILVKMFIVDATKVSGKSMQNTLHDGDILLVDKIGSKFRGYNKGDIVILKAPDHPGRLYVKRIIGEEGDTIKLKDGKVFVNDKQLQENYTSIPQTEPNSEVTEWTLGADQYFVMGDNRIPGASNDSRSFGPIYGESLVGHAFVRFYPIARVGLIDHKPYPDQNN
ncbi:signal peptidase I [Anaerococcus tetradius]|uniref:signal peptidase I n=1 Tax=Anaerococcus tetradius TaxID=33036 RepID=UPI0023F3AA98|nr:signal peptidase I [Anaerococcus tetradius]